MISITHVLCPIDFSEFSRHALDHAAAMARWYEARLTVLYVSVNRPAMDLPPISLDEAGRERLLRDMRQFTAHVSSDVSLVLRVEEAPYAHEEILAQIGTLHVDLLVLGTHGRSGFERLFLGSVTEKLIRKASCPTLIVPRRAPDVAADTPVQFHRILCPVDFSESSLDALVYALDLAEEADAKLTLLHVIEIPPELRARPPSPAFDLESIREAARADALRRLGGLVPDEARTYCVIEIAVVDGNAYRELLRQAAERQADVIVMGVHGRGAIDVLMFGSTTQHVIRAATCPVLVVRRV